MACFALGFTACSDDPEDAVSKHVYGPDEAPYLRADADATVTLNAEFRKGHVAAKTISLKDYAEQIQTNLKMTVDDMLAGLESGNVVFHSINSARGAWDMSAMTKGNGWWYNNNGAVVNDSNILALAVLGDERLLHVLKAAYKLNRFCYAYGRDDNTNQRYT